METYTYTDAWLDKHKYYIRQSTYQNYGYAIKRFKKYFTNREMNELSRAEVSDVFMFMAESGCSASSIYNVRQVMAAVYSEAIEEQQITRVTINPFKKVKIPPQASQKTVEAYTIDEQSALMQAARHELLGDYYIFLLHTGLRKSEFINLKWDDYNHKNHTISIVKSKTDNGIRTIALSDTAENIILQQPKYDHSHIFSTTKRLPVSVTSLKKLCRRLSKRVGFNVTCHRARHTFCTRMVVDAKIDAKTVCSLSGHKSVYFLMQRYVSADFSKQKKALSVLDGIMAI